MLYEGQDTAMICSGDSGVYGMAGLILELSAQYPGVEIKIIPGVTAACAGAAGLGAPLTHDFAVVSLSDRLTPIEMIWERIEKAAQADFVICLYNPRSKGRPDYLKEACERINEIPFAGDSLRCGFQHWKRWGRDEGDVFKRTGRLSGGYVYDCIHWKIQHCKDRQMDGDSTRLSAKKGEIA